MVIRGNRHIISGGIKKPITNGLDLEGTVNEIDRQGAFRYAPHHTNGLFNGIGAEDFWEFNNKLKGQNIEIYRYRRLLAEHNASSGGPFRQYNESAREDNRLAHGLLPIGGSDAKFPDQIGDAHTVFRLDRNVKGDEVTKAVRSAMQRGNYTPMAEYSDVPRIASMILWYKMRETWRYLAGKAETDAFGILPLRQISVPREHI